MKSLNKEMMKNLSFPDFEVEKIDFSPQKKILKVFVEGAWLDIEGGIRLKKGVLLFQEWESLSVNRFDSTNNTWSQIEESLAEPLKELCEVKFLDSTAYLCGFGRQTGQWVEWKIINAKMSAEFERF